MNGSKDSKYNTVKHLHGACLAMGVDIGILPDSYTTLLRYSNPHMRYRLVNELRLVLTRTRIEVKCSGQDWKNMDSPARKLAVQQKWYKNHEEVYQMKKKWNRPTKALQDYLDRKEAVLDRYIIRRRMNRSREQPVNDGIVQEDTRNAQPAAAPKDIKRDGMWAIRDSNTDLRTSARLPDPAGVGGRALRTC